MINYSEKSECTYHTQIAKGQIGRYVILPGDPKRCRMIAQHFDNPVLVADNREFVTYTGTIDGMTISVTSTGIGGPSAAIAIEELAEVGADTFIRVGTCGGMDLKVLGGDVVIASGAIRMDGTSKEYAPIEFPAVADIEIVNSLIGAAEEAQARWHVGVVQCKDSFFGQHQPNMMPIGYELINKWDAWLKCGALASEMESATLFVVGSYLRVRVGTVLLVLANQERAKQGLDNPVVHDTDVVIRMAVDAIRTLIKKDKNKNS